MGPADRTGPADHAGRASGRGRTSGPRPAGAALRADPPACPGRSAEGCGQSQSCVHSKRCHDESSNRLKRVRKSSAVIQRTNAQRRDTPQSTVTSSRTTPQPHGFSYTRRTVTPSHMAATIRSLMTREIGDAERAPKSAPLRPRGSTRVPHVQSARLRLTAHTARAGRESARPLPRIMQARHHTRHSSPVAQRSLDSSIDFMIAEPGTRYMSSWFWLPAT